MGTDHSHCLTEFNFCVVKAINADLITRVTNTFPLSSPNLFLQFLKTFFQQNSSRSKHYAITICRIDGFGERLEEWTTKEVIKIGVFLISH